MVLVGVVLGGGVDDVCPRPVHHGLHRHDPLAPLRDRAVLEPSPEQVGAQERRRVLLLGDPGPRSVRPLLARRQNQQVDLVASRPVVQERSATAKLDVVGVRPDREDLHAHASTLTVLRPDLRRCTMRSPIPSPLI